jgi:hypothetical protein
MPPRDYRDYYEKNKERLKAAERARYAANPAYAKGKQLERKYGMTLEQHADFVSARNGCCEICGSTGGVVRGRKPGLCVDHDHATGAVRGLLCPPCNVAIGLMEDNPGRLLKAAAYLESHGVPKIATG